MHKIHIQSTYTLETSINLKTPAITPLETEEVRVSVLQETFQAGLNIKVLLCYILVILDPIPHSN